MSPIHRVPNIISADVSTDSTDRIPLPSTEHINDEQNDLHQLDSSHTIYQQLHHRSSVQYCCTSKQYLVFHVVPQLNDMLCSHYNKYKYCPHYKHCTNLHIYETDYSKYNLLHRKPTKKYLLHRHTHPHHNAMDSVIIDQNKRYYTLHNLNEGEERQLSILRRTLELNGLHIIPHKQLHRLQEYSNCMIYIGKSVPNTNIMNQLHKQCKILHSRYTTELSHKDRLLYNVRTTKVYHYLPQSYILPVELNELMNEQNQCKQNQLWIMKPYNQGEAHNIIITYY